jgi:hypothetical protein
MTKITGRTPRNAFSGDLIMSSSLDPLRSLRHEGGHWAEDLLNERLMGLGSRPMDQTGEAFMKTGLTPDATTEVITGAWSRNRPKLKQIYQHDWPTLNKRGLASEFFADIADPNLRGFKYRTGGNVPDSIRQEYVSSLEGATPGLKTLRDFAQSVYNPAWERTTRGSKIATPMALPADALRWMEEK